MPSFAKSGAQSKSLGYQVESDQVVRKSLRFLGKELPLNEIRDFQSKLWWSTPVPSTSTKLANLIFVPVLDGRAVVKTP